jgi:hypothetical protein
MPNDTTNWTPNRGDMRYTGPRQAEFSVLYILVGLLTSRADSVTQRIGLITTRLQAEKTCRLSAQLLQSARVAPSSTFSVPLFRGRFFSSPPKSFQDFGPPPRTHAPRGRYNAEGIPALYLCLSVNGVKRELGTPPVGCTLWTRDFRSHLKCGWPTRES